MRSALLINGPPASGKTTVASNIIPLLKYPLLSLDTIKEVLFEELGTGDREFNRKLGKTSLSIIWALITDFSEDARIMIEAWFGASALGDIEAQLGLAGITRVAEIWCHAPGQVLADRYSQRVALRHQGHPGQTYAAELINLAEEAAPLNMGPVFSIDTSGKDAIPYLEIAAWARQALGER